MQTIAGMSTPESVQVMDYIWASLGSPSRDYTPPAWHEPQGFYAPSGGFIVARAG